VDQAFQLVSECVLFRDLERREKEALFTRVRIRNFAASDSIFLMGSPGDSMMVVLRGTVQISVTPHDTDLSDIQRELLDVNRTLLDMQLGLISLEEGHCRNRKLCGPS
jgi:signal-transduction protein with cAMP-binding, CBS, and nucleotidyltransferase domain